MSINVIVIAVTLTACIVGAFVAVSLIVARRANVRKRAENIKALNNTQGGYWYFDNYDQLYHDLLSKRTCKIWE